MTLSPLPPSNAILQGLPQIPLQTSPALSTEDSYSLIREAFAMSGLPPPQDEDVITKESFSPATARQSRELQRNTLPFRSENLLQMPPSSMTGQGPIIHPTAHPSAIQHAGSLPLRLSSVGPSTPYIGPGAYETRGRDHVTQQYDFFGELPIPQVLHTQEAGSSTMHELRHTSQITAPLYNPRAANDPAHVYNPNPIPVSTRIEKRRSQVIQGSGRSSSPSTPSPARRQTTTQSSLERRKAHRAYTQKSRNKVNSRFESLLDALPAPPPRLNPRSKAEILEYATETVIRLVTQNNKLELSLALSSTPHLDAWLSEQTQAVRTVREVCHPVMRLFTTGLDWKGCEAWAVDAEAPVDRASLAQAWTYLPPPTPGRIDQQEGQPTTSDLNAFLETGKETYYETTCDEGIAVAYRSAKPGWVSCEYKNFMGFDQTQFSMDRTRLALNYGISDALMVPLVLYNHVQIVLVFYNMRPRSPTGNPAIQPHTDPKSAIKVATETMAILARRFSSLPGVTEFTER